MGLTYLEWKETCDMALNVLCGLLSQANTSPELVEYMTNHDIDSAVRKKVSVIRVWEVDAHILAFLSVSPFIKRYWVVYNSLSIGMCLDQSEDHISNTPSFNYNRYVNQIFSES